MDSVKSNTKNSKKSIDDSINDSINSEDPDFEPIKLMKAEIDVLKLILKKTLPESINKEKAKFSVIKMFAFDSDGILIEYKCNSKPRSTVINLTTKIAENDNEAPYNLDSVDYEFFKSIFDDTEEC